MSMLASLPPSSTMISSKSAKALVAHRTDRMLDQAFRFVDRHHDGNRGG
jgi:hypothetical protein